MARVQTFLVDLSPATATANGFTMLLCDPATRKFRVNAVGLLDMEIQVRALVNDEFQRPASAYVRPVGKERKPMGFGAAAKRLEFIPYPIA